MDQIDQTPWIKRGEVHVRGLVQGKLDAASNTALRSTRRHLKFDLDKGERVHAEHGDDSCADACE